MENNKNALYLSFDQGINNFELIIIVIGIVILFLQIKQKKELKKEILIQNRFLEEIFDSQPNITILNANRKINKANKAFLDFFSLENLDEFTNMYDCICDKFIVKDGYLSKYCHDRTWLDYMYENPNKTHKVLLEKKGQIFEFVVNAKKLEFDTQNRNIVVFSDITLYSKQREIIVNQEKKAVMMDIIDNIAHQYRQPLSVISVSASAIKLKQELNDLTIEDLNSYCTVIEKAVFSLSKIIDSFRTFYKQEKIMLAFNLSELIAEVVNIYSLRFMIDNIEVMQNVPQIKMEGYKNDLVEVLMNILTNAKDELVKINSGKKLIFIEARQLENNNVEISIRDNAGGIEEKNIDKIFDSHFTTKDKGKGTGVGLYVSKKVIEESFDGSLNVLNKKFNYEEEEFFGAEFIIKVSKKKEIT